MVLNVFGKAAGPNAADSQFTCPSRARGGHLIFPALRSHKDVALASVSGIGAQSACKSFGFSTAQSPGDLLQDSVGPRCGAARSR